MSRVYIKYKLIYDDILRAFQFDMKRRGNRKKIIQSVIAVILSVGCFIYYLISQQTPLLVMALFWLALVGVAWEMPFFTVKRTARSIENQNATFTMDFVEDKLIIGYNESKMQVPYDYPNFNVYEDEALFIVYPEKNKIFCLPKRKLTKEIRERLSCDLKKLLGDRYHDITLETQQKNKTSGKPAAGKVKQPKNRG